MFQNSRELSSEPSKPLLSSEPSKPSKSLKVIKVHNNKVFCNPMSKCLEENLQWSAFAEWLQEWNHPMWLRLKTRSDGEAHDGVKKAVIKTA